MWFFMADLICITEACGGVLRVLREKKDKNYAVREYLCTNCNTPHYLPLFEGIELSDQDHQDSLMLNDPRDGHVDRRN